MGLNEQKGNMYTWVTHTFNMIKGKCPHDCSYCYMKMYKQNPVRFDASELKTDLGSGNTIFVGSSCDDFAEEIPGDWIYRMLEHLRKYPENTYLLQSKNPARIEEFRCYGYLPPKVIVGTTIESNRDYGTSLAPANRNRYENMWSIPLPKMISIEPVMDFDIDILTDWIADIKPDFVSIGADSKGNHLPEPSKEKLLKFINNLNGITEIKAKHNLNRILKGE